MKPAVRRTLKVLFWDTPKENESSAHTIIRVMGNIARSTLSIVVLIGTSLGTVNQAQSYFDQNRRAAEAVEVSFEWVVEDTGEPLECPEDMPLNLIITNGFSKPVTNVVAAIRGRRAGYSDLVAYDLLSTDAIIAQGGRVIYCTAIEVDDGVPFSQIIWDAEVLSATVWDGPIDPPRDLLEG